MNRTLFLFSALVSILMIESCITVNNSFNNKIRANSVRVQKYIEGSPRHASKEKLNKHFSPWKNVNHSLEDIFRDVQAKSLFVSGTVESENATFNASLDYLESNNYNIVLRGKMIYNDSASSRSDRFFRIIINRYIIDTLGLGIEPTDRDKANLFYIPNLPNSSPTDTNNNAFEYLHKLPTFENRIETRKKIDPHKVLFGNLTNLNSTISFGKFETYNGVLSYKFGGCIDAVQFVANTDPFPPLIIVAVALTYIHIARDRGKRECESLEKSKCAKGQIPICEETYYASSILELSTRGSHELKGCYTPYNRK